MYFKNVQKRKKLFRDYMYEEGYSVQIQGMKRNP